MPAPANAAHAPVIRLGGWRLTGIVTAVVLASALVLIVGIGGSMGARSALRMTARASLVLFLSAFTASALHRLRPMPLSRWLMRNRRYLGVAFAGSHLVHALAIGASIRADADAFYASQQPPGYLLNGIGYAFILAMAATSFRAPARMIGTTAWRWLHWVGGYYIWFAFAKSYVPRALHDGFYLPFAAALCLALALRLSAAIRTARPYFWNQWRCAK